MATMTPTNISASLTNTSGTCWSQSGSTKKYESNLGPTSSDTTYLLVITTSSDSSTCKYDMVPSIEAISTNQPTYTLPSGYTADSSGSLTYTWALPSKTVYSIYGGVQKGTTWNCTLTYRYKQDNITITGVVEDFSISYYWKGYRQYTENGGYTAGTVYAVVSCNVTTSPSISNISGVGITINYTCNFNGRFNSWSGSSNSQYRVSTPGNLSWTTGTTGTTTSEYYALGNYSLKGTQSLTNYQLVTPDTMSITLKSSSASWSGSASGYTLGTLICE
jgi:hypothetical protein